ncbi:hypothetical protein G6F43_009701 [Rhizopus delemar]|nr:hypothetical protein G6F43_009701 [Rhizopus delemar]
MTNDLQQPVILLSPAPRQEKKTSFLRRKLSSLSLGGHLAAPQEYHGSISSTSTSSSTFSNIPTPSSSTERAQPSIVLQDKYAQHKLGKRIGSGATAKLRLLEGEDGKVVAMKIYKKKDRGESEREYDKRMASEFCISKTLQHQHVVQVYDLLKDKRGRWCTVMEYCAGGDLLSILHQFDLTDNEIDCLFKQLLIGLNHIHASGVAHRDIKPDNLILTTDGLLKIADFGVADVIQSCFDSTPSYSRGKCGSEPYWSPEMFSSTEYDARALDVWSCAVTWHIMLYRRIPFLVASEKDPNYVDFLETQKDWLPLSKCSEQEKECLFGMFDPNPDTRWTIEDCLRSDWISSVEVCYESFERHKHHRVIY